MVIIQHRCNTKQQLYELPSSLGVEVDIRSEGSKLIVHHDAFQKGEAFDQWLEGYNHRLMILNVKEDGLESRLLSLMGKNHIENFFFLDQTFPSIVKMIEQGEKRCAVRISEFESIETALKLAGKIDWVWVDYFTHFPLSPADAEQLNNAGFKLCLVSPELQGFSNPSTAISLREKIATLDIEVAAICTKFPNLWAPN